MYKHYGEEVVQSITGLQQEAQVRSVWLRVYEQLIAGVDGVDNGVSQYEGAGEARYSIKTDLSSRVQALNPPWNVEATDEERDLLFQSAMEMAGQELERITKYEANSWLPARQLVEEMLRSRPQPEIGVFTQFVPWTDHLFDLEPQHDQKLLYVLFPDMSGMWRVRCVPKAPGSFESRRALPEPWRGLRGEELEKLAGPGAQFVHHAGFIGGHQTKEGAFQMAQQAIKHA